MAKKQAKSKPTKSAKPVKAPPQPKGPPAAEVLAELEAAARVADPAERSARAWQVLTRSSAAPEFAVVLDFALEHGLALPCGLSADPRKGPAPASAWLNPIDGSEMVWIPPGTFRVTKDNTPAESAGFSLARFPVTNAQFKQFLDATGYAPPPEHPYPETFLQHWEKGTYPKKLENNPVVFVSFVDALAYCKWAGLTLPTEWLWEKAARGPDGRTYPWGEAARAEATRKLANVETTGTCAVGSCPRTRSPYGCEDLVGNVSEWCQPSDEDNPGAMPGGWPEVVIDEGVLTAVRGACFLRVASWRVASSRRRRLSVIRRNKWVGFRPASLLPCRPAT